MQASFENPKYKAPIFIGNILDARHNSFHAEMMGDFMYLQQELLKEDAAEFTKVVVKKVNSHVEQKHWRLIDQSKMPEGKDSLPTI